MKIFKAIIEGLIVRTDLYKRSQQRNVDLSMAMSALLKAQQETNMMLSLHHEEIARLQNVVYDDKSALQLPEIKATDKNNLN